MIKSVEMFQQICCVGGGGLSVQLGKMSWIYGCRSGEMFGYCDVWCCFGWRCRGHGECGMQYCSIVFVFLF